jgi:CRP/FNR family cyclic AMP-dependent transcriptional regulator
MPKRTEPVKPAAALDWSTMQSSRLVYEPTAQIFAQGDPATSVMYVEDGVVRLSVVSHTGKEVVVALVEAGHFFGEGCMAGQSHRMATATAMTPCTLLSVEQHEMVRQIHADPVFADRFLTHMLSRNMRIEEDLVDQRC